MNRQTIWYRLIADPSTDTLLPKVLTHVAAGISTMAHCDFNSTPPNIQHVPFSEVPDLLGSLEQESVGVYLRMEQGLTGQALLMLPLPFALNLSEMVMGRPHGSASHLGQMERSALAEVGNLTLSYFLNAVATHTHRDEILWPSPPTIMVDMLGAILEVIVAAAASTSDDIVIIETVFQDTARLVWARLWNFA